MARTDYGAILSTKIADTSQAIRDVNGTVGTIAPADWGTLIRNMKSGADYQNALNQMVEESATGSIASFTDGANQIPCKEVICHINPTETGTGEKSPQNPYVIGGFTEANITRTGKNLFDVNSVTVADITFKGESGVTKRNGFIYNLPSGIYTLSSSTNIESYIYMVVLARNGDFKSFVRLTATTSVMNPKTITLADGDYIIIYAAVSGSTLHINRFDHFMIEVGSTATTYEPYTGDTNTVSFGQTVYGGTLNVTTGVLTVTYGLRIFSNEPWSETSSAYYHTNGFMKKGNGLDGWANWLKTLNVIGAGIQFGANNNTLYIGKTINSIIGIESLSEFNQYIINHPLIIVYPLATPITIQLIPTEIKTLLGANNIYHDCNGDIDVTYRANGALYVEQHP